MCRASSAKVGLPEVTLGLSLEAVALYARRASSVCNERCLCSQEGRQYDADAALKEGLIHEVVDREEDLAQRALSWMEANPEAKQPWDSLDIVCRAGVELSKASTDPRGGTRDAPPKDEGVFPAPEAILSAMVEGALLSFEAACRVESRYFVQLVCSPVAKNMINTFWYQLNELKAGRATCRDPIE